MNREIKFRAWVERDEPIMVYENDKSDYMIILSGGEFNIVLDYDYYVLTDVFHIMQYIGLKDKNKKEVYEGDILKNINTGQVIYIKYNKSIAGFSVYDNEGSELMFGFHRMKDACEVIGNIFENKELLNE